MCLLLLLAGCTPVSKITPDKTATIYSPTTTVTLTPLPTQTETPTFTPTPAMWEIQTCHKAPSAIRLDDDWIWEDSGAIEGLGELKMLLNFTANNEILGFALNSDQVREYTVSGCVQEQIFTMWLRQGDSVAAVIRGEFPATDPHGELSGKLDGDVITGSLIKKTNTNFFNLSQIMERHSWHNGTSVFTCSHERW